MLIVTGLFLVSCNRSSAGPEPISSQKEAYQQGFDELNIRIAEFEKEAGFSRIDTRAGFWSKLGWIVGADALGGMVGSVAGPVMAIIVSAASSISAAFSALIVGNDSFTWDNTKSAAGEFDEIITALGDMGLEHNQILQLFFEMDNPDFNVMTTNQRSEYILQRVREIIQNNYQTDVPSLDDCLSFSSQQTMLPFDSVDELAAGCILSNPQLTNEINVIKHCVQTYSSLDMVTDITAYSKGLSSIIEEATIPVSSKEQIKSGASVAAFSRLYWEDSIN